MGFELLLAAALLGPYKFSPEKVEKPVVAAVSNPIKTIRANRSNRCANGRCGIRNRLFRRFR